MLDCKKALEESEVMKRIEWLRKKGINTANKKQPEMHQMD